jgi:trimethylamine--corrinoid protein Co-methyltransferase
MNLATMAVLSEFELQALHEATLGILAESGVKVLSARMLESLRARGLSVDVATQTVRFPRAVLEDAIACLPPRIEVFDREGQPAFTLGNGVPKIAAGHNAVFWVDSATGATRPSRVEDVARFARLCEQLPVIDMIGIPVMPQDVNVAKATLLHAVAATAQNSRKPVYFSTDSAAVNRGCIE